MKIKYLKHGYYGCNYPPGSVVEVDENYGRYVIGIEDAAIASAEDKITDPIPYVMAVRESPSDNALTMIANVLKEQQQQSKQSAPAPDRKAG